MKFFGAFFFLVFFVFFVSIEGYKQGHGQHVPVAKDPHAHGHGAVHGGQGGHGAQGHGINGQHGQAGHGQSGHGKHH